MRTALVISLAALALCACTNQPQRPAIDTQLNSGVTSSNGGGQRATGAIPSFGVGPGGATSGSVPAGRGSAY